MSFFGTWTRQNSALITAKLLKRGARRGNRSQLNNSETATVSQSDPTDHALAAIASILDQPPEIHREMERPAIEPKQAAPVVAAPPPLAPAPMSGDSDTYSRIGPGPIAAIRFKWTTRGGENGEYFVDETIGENSTAITTGPMSRDEAIELVDERESEARRRFEQL